MGIVALGVIVVAMVLYRVLWALRREERRNAGSKTRQSN